MKYQILLGILFTLLSHKKASARELADKYGVSERTIYRYVDELSLANIPVYVERGRYGGICIPDSYRLPVNFFTEGEYRAIVETLESFNGELNNSELSSALEKIKMQIKRGKGDFSVRGDILIDSSTWGDANGFSEKLKIIQQAIQDTSVLAIQYRSRIGEDTFRDIEPYVLILKQNIWYIYAYCRLRADFRLFKLGRIRTMTKKNEHFVMNEINREEIPLKFWQTAESAAHVAFAIEERALPAAEEWLGADNIVKKGEGYYAEVDLPDDDALISKILSLGSGVQVTEPEDIRQKILAEAKKLLSSYS